MSTRPSLIMADQKLNACADQLVYLPTQGNMHTQHVHIHYMQWFWEIVHTYSEKDLAILLQFVTGR